MKKNNSYSADDEIDLGDLIRTLWREKILILSISIICGLLGYLYALFQPEEFKTEIKIKNPSFQLFESYSHILSNNPNNPNDIIVGQFISDFKLNLLSLDNLEIFVEESRDLDIFKKYLKSRNISVKQYFTNRFGQVKEKNINDENKFFLVFEKKILVGHIFFNNYLDFIKKKNITELKKNLKLEIENRIAKTEDALEIAKLINLENPILKTPDSHNHVVNEPDALFYKGTKVLAQSIIIDKKLLQKLENDQFNYNPIADKATEPEITTMTSYFFLLKGLFFGIFLSCIITFFKSALKK
jgi:LPS O-antigen subunit length determinant protein (WzzB/FepE family)